MHSPTPRAFESADGLVDHPITAVAGLVPGLAQHRRAITELTAAGADTASALAVDLGGVDLDALSVNEGRIDLDAVRSQQRVLLSIDGEIARLQQTLAEVDSPWLVHVSPTWSKTSPTTSPNNVREAAMR